MEVVFEYDLRMICRIDECRVNVVEILLQPVGKKIKKLEERGIKKKKGRTKLVNPLQHFPKHR